MTMSNDASHTNAIGIARMIRNKTSPFTFSALSDRRYIESTMHKNGTKSCIQRSSARFFLFLHAPQCARDRHAHGTRVFSFRLKKNTSSAHTPHACFENCECDHPGNHQLRGGHGPRSIGTDRDHERSSALKDVEPPPVCIRLYRQSSVPRGLRV